ncbi:MAG: fimbrillin family protein [Bacteroides sp.]|nr:fimbrillin family protein [Bacteroides sp.]
MKRLKYIMLYAGLLAITACSSEEFSSDETDRDAEVCLAVSVSGSEAASRAGESYIKTAFASEDQIRLVNTKFFGEPTFDDNTIYSYKEKGTEWDEFTPLNENSVTWNDFSPTSFVYMFEAIYYPGNNPFDYVPTDQNSEENFKKADLLLAHHRMSLDERFKEIYLTFHHAFAMIRVEAIVPIGTGGLPQNAIQSASLKNVQTKYKIDYTSTIQNDALRTVTGQGPLTHVTMWLQSKQVNSSDKTQTYIFLGIIPVPQQQIVGTDFVHFKVKVNNTEKIYRFVPDKSISLRQAHVTILRLKLGTNGDLPLLLDAEIKPWTEASAGMILDEEDSSTDNGQTGEGNQPDDQEGGA